MQWMSCYTACTILAVYLGSQVVNLGDGRGGPTVSCNQNWLNAHNLKRVWSFLLEELRLARAAIEHEREAMGEEDWKQHVALIMKANCGINPAEFVDLVRCGVRVAATGPG